MPHEIKRILVKALALRAFRLAILAHLFLSGTWLVCALIGHKVAAVAFFVAALVPAVAVFVYFFRQGLSLHGLEARNVARKG